MEKKKSISVYEILLAVLVLVQLCYTTYVFVHQKQGFHMDEIWSYGLANSTDGPFLDVRDGVGYWDITVDQFENLNEWVSGELFHDYLTVQPDERFDYASVWHNQTLDVHPPLYYILLHTVCSFFPNQFSGNYAFFLNVIFLIGTQIYLYLLTRRLSGSPATALVTCVLYGGGMGALSTFVFLRQYGMVTMLAVAYTYYAVMYYGAERKGEDRRKDRRYLAGAVITAFLAFMTQYLGVAYVGILTACMCLMLLAHKELRRMFVYGGSLLAALGVFLLIYPSALRQVMQPGYYMVKYYRDITQIRMLLNYWSTANMGYETAIFGTIFWNVAPIVIAALLVLVGAAAFVSRNETWFPRVVDTVKGWPRRLLGFMKKADYAPLAVLLGALGMYPVVSKLVNVAAVEEAVIRYVFLTFPLLDAAIVTLAGGLLKCVPRVKRYSQALLAAMVLVVLVRVHLMSPCYFLYPHYGDYQDVPAMVEGKNIVLVTDFDYSHRWMMTYYAPYVYTAEHVFCTSAESLEEQMDNIAALGEDIDYVFATPFNLSFRPEEMQKVFAWLFGEYKMADAEGTEGPTTAEEAADVMQEAVLTPEETSPCTHLIKSLNGGCDYEILFGINTHYTPVFVLRLTDSDMEYQK